MNSELIPVLIGFTVVYAWSLIVAYGHLRIYYKENAKLRAEIMSAARNFSILSAAKEGDYETARLMAAMNRDHVKTKPPVSAGAKKKPETGLRITQGD